MLLDASAAHSYTNSRETKEGASLFTTSETGLPHSPHCNGILRETPITSAPGRNTTAPSLSLE